MLNIPIVAMVDTNCNPQNIDYVIPSNDDAIRAIKLLVAKVADAVLEGKAMRKEEDEDKAAAEAQPRTEKASRRIPKVVDVDEELEDNALLGEATLAKLSAAREDVVAVEAPAVENPAPVAPETDAKPETEEK